MSVRRLAEDIFQPESFAFNAENEIWAKHRISLYPEGRQQSAVIPLLMRAQEQEGWVSRAAIENVAQTLAMPYIRVLEVATFYTQFQLKPVGRNAHIQVCGTTPCMLRGAGELISVCKSKINPQAHELNEDGTLSWEEVECAGACVNAPMIAIGPETYEDLTAVRFAEIIDAFQAGNGADVPVGSQIDRQNAGQFGGRTTLLGDAPFNVKTMPKVAVDAVAEQPLPIVPDDKSESLFVRPAGDVDQLELISGVGEVLSAKLIALGITQFRQVALLTDGEVEKLDTALGFGGRVTRDAWREQAKALADGGVEEYQRVFGKKPQ